MLSFVYRQEISKGSPMNPFKILDENASLIEYISERLLSGEFDYTKSIVVFPGRRPAHILRKTLAENIGTCFFPPQIFSIEDFIEHIYENILKTPRKKLETFDAIALLYDIHRKAENKVGKNYYTSLDSFLPLGRKLFSELEELVLSGVSQRRLREIVGQSIYQSFQPIYYYYDNFYKEIKQRGYVTRSTLYCSVAENISNVDLNTYEKIILAGFYAFTNVEMRIIRNLLGKDNVETVFQNGFGLESQLKKLSPQVKIGEYKSLPLENICFYRAPDSHGQIFALAEKFKNFLRGRNTLYHRTAIVIPSYESLFPVLHNVLSMVPNNEYNIAVGYPISRTPVYGFLNSLMDLVSSIYENKLSPSEYLKFVLH